MTSDYYILDKNGNPKMIEDVLEWGAWMEKADRTIERTNIDGVEISTVFLGLDHGFNSPIPILYETMVFDDYGSNQQYRYATRKDAIKGHRQTVREITENYERTRQITNTKPQA